MNISPNLHATRRRSERPFVSRAEISDHRLRQVEKEQGSPLPALLLLGAVCAAAWLWMMLR